MKIYFAGSIRGGRDDKEIYCQIINHLNQYGIVLTEHIGYANLTQSGEKELNDEQIYERDISWVQEADIIVADVSTTSLGVGYEIGFAEKIGKTIFCLYRQQNDKRLSAMINGNKNIEVKVYSNLGEALKHIEYFFESLKTK